jgi:hypothetical protein
MGEANDQAAALADVEMLVRGGTVRIDHFTAARRSGAQKPAVGFNGAQAMD